VAVEAGTAGVEIDDAGGGDLERRQPVALQLGVGPTEANRPADLEGVGVVKHSVVGGELIGAAYRAGGSGLEDRAARARQRAYEREVLADRERVRRRQVGAERVEKGVRQRGVGGRQRVAGAYP